MSSSCKNVTILGATGSIGVNTLDVIARHPDAYAVFALTANRNVELLRQQVLEHQPVYAVLQDEAAARTLREQLAAEPVNTEVLCGIEALQDVARATEVDYVMAAIVGAAGLLPTLAAVNAGKRVLLANKEALVMTGKLFMQAVADAGAELLPIDSEHNAIYQCLPVANTAQNVRAGVNRIVLTASGGPFRAVDMEQLAAVTPAQACAHPNWAMGAKISVDSATMMNKGLELIEACWLFDTTQDNVDILIHPQSIVHSLVEYSDGSMLAQMGNPDMRTPIAYGLGWPGRIESGVASLDLASIGRLEFEPLDRARFPCVRLSEEAMAAGGTATATLNAANEVAVAAFLAGRISYLAIAEVVDRVMQSCTVRPADSVAIVLEEDRQARQLAEQAIAVSTEPRVIMS
jgi:1-deoxy-D-xylulose-5-phosphate reductoisomerase